MKRVAVLLLVLALSFAFGACAKKDQETTTATTTAQQTTAAPEEKDVYNYEAIEGLLKDNAYQFLGGYMELIASDKKLYCADSEYNTSKVEYYDFKTGKIGTVATDENNTASGPVSLSNTGAVVLSLKEPVEDPSAIDWKAAQYHIYDYASNSIKTMDNHFDFSIAAIKGDTVYGCDYNNGTFVIAGQDGTVQKSIPFGKDINKIQAMYFVGEDIYVEIFVSGGENTLVEIAKVSGDTLQTVFETTNNVFFDGSDFYCLKSENGTTAIEQYILSSGEKKTIAQPEGILSLYCVAGDRIYFAQSIDESSIIALSYYDMKTQKTQQFDKGQPQLGGW